MLKSKLSILLLLIATLVSFSAACNSDDEEGSNNEYNKENILPGVYDHYVGKNLEDAKHYAETLKSSSEALCGNGPATYTCKIKDQNKQAKECLQHAWVELNEYATKRLQVFNKYINFQQPIFDKLDNHKTSDEIKTRVTSSPEDLSGGFDSLPVLEAVIFDQTGAAPTKGNNQCKFVLKSSDAISKHVETLESVWKVPAHKEAFIQKGKTDQAIKKLFTAMQGTFDDVNANSFAAPAGLNTDGSDKGTADATKTEAPYAKRGGWMVYQVVSRGPLGLYQGTYKQKDGKTWSKSTLEAYVKKLDGGEALNTKILEDYKALKEKFDAGLQTGTNGLEAAIGDITTKKNDIKAVISIIKKIAEDFKTAADKIQ